MLSQRGIALPSSHAKRAQRPVPLRSRKLHTLHVARRIDVTVDPPPKLATAASPSHGISNAQQNQQQQQQQQQHALGSQMLGEGHPEAHIQEHPGFSFKWFDHWYPLSPLTYLDPKRPAHFDLLGMSLVVWANSKGQWSCMRDKCSHRLAPLSEGRIEGDALQCSYHGWKFDCQGACTHIPQIDDPKAQSTALSSPRSGVQAFPTRVQHGLLWVFPRATAPVVSFPTDLGHLDGERFTWNVRDMPLRWDTVLENVMDPSHVPFAHRGVQGSEIINQPMIPGQLTPQGFTVDMGAAPPPVHTLRIIGQWQPPFRYRVFLPGGPSYENWVVPTRPGWCRFMASLPHPWVPKEPFGFPKSLSDLKKRASVWFLKTFPTLDHLYRQQVLDGDAMILHLAERELHVQSHGDWRHQYYMPASADSQVSTFRRWLNAFSGSVPTCSSSEINAMAAPSPKEQVLDRWSQHTRSCQYCLRAVKALDAAILVCKSLGYLAASAMAASLVLMITSSGIINSVFQAPLDTSHNPSAASQSLSTNIPEASAVAATTITVVATLLPCWCTSAAGAAAVAAATTVAMLLAVKGLQRWRSSYFYLGYDHTAH